MAELLDLPKPKQEIQTVERDKTRDSADENKLIKGVGARLCPDGMEYVSSFAVHIYKHKISGDFIIYQQITSMRGTPESVANEATKQITIGMMKCYGHVPPRKRGEKRADD